MKTIMLSLLSLIATSAVTAIAQDARCYAVMDESHSDEGLQMLVERPEVQADLSLTTDQLNAMSQSKGQSSLEMILDPPQMDRLYQLLVQMWGPVIITTDSKIQAELQITTNQLATFKDTVNHYDFYRWPFVKRYGRQQVAGIVRQNMVERITELDALYLVISELMKDRDRDLLNTLSGEQKRAFEQLAGKSLPIDWPKHRMIFGD